MDGETGSARVTDLSRDSGNPYANILSSDYDCPMPFCTCNKELLSRTTTANDDRVLKEPEGHLSCRKKLQDQSDSFEHSSVGRRIVRTIKERVQMEFSHIIEPIQIPKYIDYLTDKTYDFDVDKVITITEGDNHHLGSTWVLLKFRGEIYANNFMEDINKVEHDPPVNISLHLEYDSSSAEILTLQQSIWRTMSNQIQQPLSIHQRKIDDINEQIRQIQDEMSRRNTIEDYQFGIESHQSKLSEAEKSLEEFGKFLVDCRKKLDIVSSMNDKSGFFNQMQADFKVELKQFSSCLPIYARKSDIKDTVSGNQVCVILGETGSGKSTQMVQYLLKARLSKTGKIVCTQPRKIAATSLALHVAQELGSNDMVVGYEVGRDKLKNSDTCILYVTDHLLLQRSIHDPLFSEYSCIIIDEAHERSLQTDLLLAMIKRCLPKRPDLRLIITSATIDPDVFVKYFGGCPVLKVSGRAFPVDVEYLSEPIDTDFVKAAVQKVVHIHHNEPPGDILVFLTSGQDTERAMKMIPTCDSTFACQLHGRLQPAEQKLAFDPAPEGKRKIIFATNCAETSITIAGIKYVVDTGLVKASKFDHNRKLNVLEVGKISQSSADQRKGRAGRIESGKCFRLYTKDEFDKMDKNTQPEIMRIHLGMGLLQLIHLDVCDYKEFDFVQSPSPQALMNSMSELEELGACKEGKLTNLGTKMAKLSIEPHLAKLLLLGLKHGVGYECLIIAGFGTMSGSVFYRVGDEKKKIEADMSKLKYSEEDGDMLTLLAVYKDWSKVPPRRRSNWCVTNSINGKAMRLVQDSMDEIECTLARELKVKIPHTFCSEADCTERIKCIIFHSFSGNLCYFRGHKLSGYMNAISLEQDLFVHPSSSALCCGTLPTWLVYTTLQTTSRSFMLNVTTVPDDWVRHWIDRNLLAIDENKLDECTVQLLQIDRIGPMCLEKIVGHRFKRLNKMRDDFQMDHKRKVITEVSREEGIIRIWTHSSLQPLIRQNITDMLAEARRVFHEQTMDIPFASGCSYKAILGRGGLIQEILYPEEYLTVSIQNVPEEFAASEITKHLSSVITDQLFPIKHGDNINHCRGEWGKVIVASSMSAAEMQRKTSGLPFLVTSLNDVPKKLPEKNCSISVTWIRRPRIPFCIIDLTPGTSGVALANAIKEIHFPSLCRSAGIFACASQKNPHDQSVEVSLEQLKVNGIPVDLPEKEILKILSDVIRGPQNEEVIAKVNFLRKKIPPETDNYLQNLEQNISTILTNGGISMGKDEVKVVVVKPGPKSWDYKAFVNCIDASVGEKAASILSHSTVNGQVLNISQFQLNMKIAKYIHKFIQSDLATVLKGVDVIEKDLTNAVGITMRFGSGDGIDNIKKNIQKLIQGTRMETNRADFIRLSSENRGFLASLRAKRNVLAKPDYRLAVILLFGQEDDIAQAKADIELHLQENIGTLTKEFSMQKYSKGSMKKLVCHYKPDLSALKSESGVTFLQLDLRMHTLKADGSEEALGKLDTVLSDLLGAADMDDRELGEDDCPVCFTQVDSTFVIMELCGHKYCKDCARLMLHSSMNDRSFPIKCVTEGCDHELALCDMMKILGNSHIDLQPLVASSLANMLARNVEEMKPCITPDCLGIYRCQKGPKFTCVECGVSVCTSCHTEHHSGKTCYNAAAVQEEWIKGDPENRAACPGCDSYIEKDGGCQRVTCSFCKISICWRCKAVFPTSTLCYDHLSKEHGGYF